MTSTGFNYFKNSLYGIDAANPYHFSRPNNTAFKSLYNGNIAGMSVNLAALAKANTATVTNTNAKPLFYNYCYDQLNRIKSMDAYEGMDNAVNQWTPLHLDDYTETVSYDPNGNIISYNRNGSPSMSGKQQQMDALSYSYIASSNKLRHVKDAIGDANYTEDIDNQSDDNYTYDAIGNLVSDVKEGITEIKWTVYGKIAQITKSDNSIIKYTYDASGNRISKAANNKTTVYVRDASGNVMSLYEREGTGAVVQAEIHLYGSSRLGMLTTRSETVTTITLQTGYGTANNIKFTRGEKLFELSNHLGNVLATVTDRKLQVQNGTTGNVGYYDADVVSANDYYPFGMLMPERKFSSDEYRYGFNGKENDNEVKGDGNQQDYGMRVSDPRIAKFLSNDPLANKYPELTPYQFASNTPILAIDLDGLEAFPEASPNVLKPTGNVEKYTTSAGYPAESYQVKEFGIIYNVTKISTDETVKDQFGNSWPMKYFFVQDKSLVNEKDKATDDGLSTFKTAGTNMHFWQTNNDLSTRAKQSSQVANAIGGTFYGVIAGGTFVPAALELAPMALEALVNEAALLRYIPKTYITYAKAFTANVFLQGVFNGKDADFFDAAVASSPYGWFAWGSSPLIDIKPISNPGKVNNVFDGSKTPEQALVDFGTSTPFFFLGRTMKILNPIGTDLTTEFFINAADGASNKAANDAIGDKIPKPKQ